MKKRDPNIYPPGWNRKRVEAVIHHYETQTPEEEAAEDEAACSDKQTTFICVPTALVPRVQKLLASVSRQKPARTKSQTQATDRRISKN